MRNNRKLVEVLFIVFLPEFLFSFHYTSCSWHWHNAVYDSEEKKNYEKGADDVTAFTNENCEHVRKF